MTATVVEDVCSRKHFTLDISFPPSLSTSFIPFSSHLLSSCITYPQPLNYPLPSTVLQQLQSKVSDNWWVLDIRHLYTTCNAMGRGFFELLAQLWVRNRLLIQGVPENSVPGKRIFFFFFETDSNAIYHIVYNFNFLHILSLTEFKLKYFKKGGIYKR